MGYNPIYRGKISKAPSRAFSTGYENGTLSGILMARPVSTDTTGKLGLTNVSDQISVERFLGLSAELIPVSASGQVISGGRADALGAQLSGFTYGDPVYDQNITFVSGSPANGNEIQGPVNAGIAITLPLSKTFTGKELEITLNGQLLEDVFDYMPVGSAPHSQVSFTFQLVVGDVLSFRTIRGP